MMWLLRDIFSGVSEPAVKKIVRAYEMAQGRQAVKLSDLKAAVTRNRTLLEEAELDEKVLRDVFNPGRWIGYADEMEALWQYLNPRQRAWTGADIEKSRITLSALEGRESRASTLFSAGIRPSEMHAAVKSGMLDVISARMEPHGLRLMPYDALMQDSDGKHALQSRDGWAHFDKFAETCKKNGTPPDVKFFLSTQKEEPSILDYAFTFKAQDKIFNARVFEDRPEEFLTLYDALSPENREKINIDSLLSDIMVSISNDSFEVNDDLTLDTLKSPLYKTAHSAVIEKGLSIVPLALEKTWGAFDEVIGQLKNKGQNLNLDVLRQPSGFPRQNCLYRGVKFGQIDKIVDLMVANGESFTAHDLLGGDDNAVLLDLLIEQEQTGTLLNPMLWAGNTATLSEVWENLDPDTQYEKRDDFRRVLRQANLMGLQKVTMGGADLGVTTTNTPSL